MSDKTTAPLDYKGARLARWQAAEHMLKHHRCEAPKCTCDAVRVEIIAGKMRSLCLSHARLVRRC